MTDEGKHNIYFAGNSWHCLNIYCLASLFIQIFSFIWGDSLTDGWIGKRLNKQPVLTGGKANTCLWLREHWGGLSFNVSLWSFFSVPVCFQFFSPQLYWNHLMKVTHIFILCSSDANQQLAAFMERLWHRVWSLCQRSWIHQLHDRIWNCCSGESLWNMLHFPLFDHFILYWDFYMHNVPSSPPTHRLTWGDNTFYDCYVI